MIKYRQHAWNLTQVAVGIPLARRRQPRRFYCDVPSGPFSVRRRRDSTPDILIHPLPAWICAPGASTWLPRLDSARWILGRKKPLDD